MPTPGNGTNKVGDTPQEILFIVTDGVEDEAVSSGGNCQSSTRECSTMVGSKDWCTPLKNKGITVLDREQGSAWAVPVASVPR